MHETKVKEKSRKYITLLIRRACSQDLTLSVVFFFFFFFRLVVFVMSVEGIHNGSLCVSQSFALLWRLPAPIQQRL